MLSPINILIYKVSVYILLLYSMAVRSDGSAVFEAVMNWNWKVSNVLQVYILISCLIRILKIHLY